MKHLNRNRIAILVMFFGLLAAGCKNVLDIDSTRTVGEKNMWNKLEDSRAALMGTYSLTRAALVDNNAHWIYGDLRSGEFTSPTRQDLKAVINNNLSASYPALDALSNWRRWYAVINSANIFLERVGDVKAADPRYTENNMIVDVAQARFLRAFAYFYIVRIWGDVPFIISSHDGSFENKARESKDKVMAWAEQEILLAAADLPYKYSANDIQMKTGGTGYSPESCLLMQCWHTLQPGREIIRMLQPTPNLYLTTMAKAVMAISAQKNYAHRTDSFFKKSTTTCWDSTLIMATRTAHSPAIWKSLRSPHQSLVKACQICL
jgi:hypothetical protein